MADDETTDAGGDAGDTRRSVPRTAWVVGGLAVLGPWLVVAVTVLEPDLEGPIAEGGRDVSIRNDIVVGAVVPPLGTDIAYATPRRRSHDTPHTEYTQ